MVYFQRTVWTLAVDFFLKQSRLKKLEAKFLIWVVVMEFLELC